MFKVGLPPDSSWKWSTGITTEDQNEIQRLKAKILEARDCLKSLRIDYKTQPMTLNWIDSTIISLEEE